MDAGAIVVGTDGTASSHAAVRWAAREAVRLDVPLRVVYAYAGNREGARFGDTQQRSDLAAQQATAVTSAALEQARAAAPTVPAEARMTTADPVPYLLKEAEHASLIVLGNRGRGGFASLLLGSVSQQVATHSPGPVVVVRGRGDITEGAIAVGVDNSPTAHDVLGTAFEMAAARACPLVAIRTYLPPGPLWADDVPPADFPTPENDAAEREWLTDQLAQWRQKYPQVPTEALISHGGAAAVLVGVSHTAQLVVVGGLGHAAIAGMLLGSTGLQLLHHADCPVVIVRSRKPVAG